MNTHVRTYTCKSTYVESKLILHALISQASRTITDTGWSPHWHKASRNIENKTSKSNPQIKARELLEKRKNELTETDNGSKVVTEKYSGLRIR